VAGLDRANIIDHICTSAQAALLFGCPLPSCLLWSLIAAAAATVLSFSILTGCFPIKLPPQTRDALLMSRKATLPIATLDHSLIRTARPHIPVRPR
jgi:hypothetical protein